MWSSQANQTPRTGRCVFAARREIEKTRGEFQLSRRQCGTKGTKWPVEELIIKCGVARPIGVEFARPLFPEQSSRRGQGNKLASGAKRTAQRDHAPLCSEALSTAAFVLVPAVGLAQEPANGTGNTKDEPGVVGKVIEKITGRSPDTKEGNKSGDRDSPAESAASTDYPDFAAVKKTGK